MSQTGCSQSMVVDENLRAMLNQLPGETYEAQDEYQCDLQLTEHDGLHHAVAQGAEDPHSGTEFWIRWGDGLPPELVELPNCESERGDELCVLFDDHSGRHTSGDNAWD